tara:strand:+ start:327 stop:791 length:465 start_codon:yes stop_codon:yes gene_type:complete
MHRLLLVLTSLLSPLAGAAPDPQLTAALTNLLGAEPPAYQSALRDLNADGIDDALIYPLGPDWCGSAGCTLFVLQGSADGFTLLSKTTIVQLPLRVSSQQTHGWHDLIVYAKGEGDVVLRATEAGYPLNPSLQPKAMDTDLQDSQLLLDYQRAP